MTSRIIGWWIGLSLLGESVFVVATIALVVVVVVLLRGPAPPPEVVYP